MRVALLQTMYDEHENVFNNIKETSSIYRDAVCLVTHSFDKESSILGQIKLNSYYNSLQNLGNSLERLKIPAYSISRNYADLFNRLYLLNYNVDLIVALTGDTKLTDVNSFTRRYDEMKKHNYKLYACQAKEQVFWTKDKTLTRFQTKNIADFMPQLFFVDGSFAIETKVFSKIKITNEYTSEQCLSDAFLIDGEFNDIGRLNKEKSNWADYTDGVIWQCLTNGRPGR